MEIFASFQHINLTDDQRNALESLQEFLTSKERVFILNGYAGTGKTTLLKGLSDYLTLHEKKFSLMAPTGRAANVIKTKTGCEASTIHRGIYSYDDLVEVDNGEHDEDISFYYQYKIRTNPTIFDSVLLIDEASMISDVDNQDEFFRFGSGRLLQDLFEYSRILDNALKSKIIFFGDPAQLPPVGMNSSPALDPDYIFENYGVEAKTVVIKEVKRQSENSGILDSAIKIRQCLTSGYFNDFDIRENTTDIFNPGFDVFMDTYKATDGKRIVICHKNETALKLNNQIRSSRFGEHIDIQSSDIIIIGANNYNLGIMNGEFGVVTQSDDRTISREVVFFVRGGEKRTVRLTWRYVELTFPKEENSTKTVSAYMLENFLYGENRLTPEEQKALYIDFKMRHPKLKMGTEEFKQALLADDFFNCIKLKYGYAVTCHKAQGGEWSNAFVFWDRGTKPEFNFYEAEHDRSGKTNSEFYRWAYTAITRASDRLYCINPPYFSSYSEMTFIHENVQNSLDELTGQKSKSIEVELNEALPQLKRFGLDDAPLTIQDHFIKRWYHLKGKLIDAVSWERVGYEIRYVFSREGQSAGFMYWVNGKDEFRMNFQKLPQQTNSNDLFETISTILENSSEVIVNRNSADGILTQIEFDIEIEESKPFLKILYNQINAQLENDESIIKITHLNYRERYTFDKYGKECTVDFVYNDHGFFGRVVPLVKKCNSAEMLIKVREIVKNLKSASHVV